MIMRYYSRKLQKRIFPWISKPDTIVILGARQVGKTTLLELLRKEIEKKWGDSKNILTFNLEDENRGATKT